MFDMDAVMNNVFTVFVAFVEHDIFYVLVHECKSHHKNNTGRFGE